MSHFAEIDSNKIVQQVIVAEKDFINSGTVGEEFNWIQCSLMEIFGKLILMQVGNGIKQMKYLLLHNLMLHGL